MTDDDIDGKLHDRLPLMLISPIIFFAVNRSFRSNDGANETKEFFSTATIFKSFRFSAAVLSPAATHAIFDGIASSRTFWEYVLELSRLVL